MMRRRRVSGLTVCMLTLVCVGVHIPWVTGGPSENPASPTTVAVDNEPGTAGLNETCTESHQCAVTGAVCSNNTCQCGPEMPVTNSVDKCGKAQGNAKLNEGCSATADCGVAGSVCDQEVCKCHEDLPATNNVDKCGKVRNVNQNCTFNEQCSGTALTECVDGQCACTEGRIAYPNKDGVLQCRERGKLKISDICNETLDCGFDGAECTGKGPTQRCQCAPDMKVTNTIDKCGRPAKINESCTFNEECEYESTMTECRERRCMCRFQLTLVLEKDGTLTCAHTPDEPKTEHHVDPAVIGVLVGMGLMFIILCVVLRLFSKARWRENRTIFNTPNPRLMNVSLLRDSKLLHSGGERRGSRASVRAPSRQPSMASLRPQSPSQSIGSRRSRRSSSPSVTSTKSPKSPTKQTANNVANNAGTPVLENVTVEVQDPKV